MNSNNIIWSCNNSNCKSFSKELKGQHCSTCSTKYQANSTGVWDIMPEFLPNGFPLSRCKHLNQLEKDHFWFKPRARLLRSFLNKTTKNSGNRILEMGCGSGNFFNSFNNNYCVVGVDGHMNFLKIAKLNNPEIEYLHCDIAALPVADQQFDVILAFDVLEHVDSKKLLEEAYRLTKPGGKILISVPAFPFLWSKVDEQAGHNYRYTLKQIKKELGTSDWQYCYHSYYQFFLFPFVYLSRKLHSNKAPKIEHKPPKIINKLFYYLNSLEVFLFSKIKLPFGSSIITIATKPKK